MNYIVIGIIFVIIIVLVAAFLKSNPPAPAPPAACVPSCTNSNGATKNCGDDGCGGTCGKCADGYECSVFGICMCSPQCPTGKCNISDGCGGQCNCPTGKICSNGECIATPENYCAAGQECGPDGHGNSCGECQNLMETCVNGLCQSSNACGGKNCGQDVFGNDCGVCKTGETCQNGYCTAPPPDYCQGKNCGPDNHGGSCGTCVDGYTCSNGYCTVIPVDHCGGKTCGSDGYGGSCGTCDDGETCNEGVCVDLPSNYCGSKKCGDDGYGNNCGTCSGTDECTNGVCTSHQSLCGTYTCGNDPNGISCGTCGYNQSCIGGYCKDNSTVPPTPQFTQSVFYYSPYTNKTAGVLEWTMDYTYSSFSNSNVQFKLQIVYNYGTPRSYIGSNSIISAYVVSGSDPSLVYYKNSNDLPIGGSDPITLFLIAVSGAVQSSSNTSCKLSAQSY